MIGSSAEAEAADRHWRSLPTFRDSTSSGTQVAAPRFATSITSVPVSGHGDLARNLIRRRFTKALCIFPFEEQFLKCRRADEFIGHPLVGDVNATKDRKHVLRGTGIDPNADRRNHSARQSRRGDLPSFPVLQEHRSLTSMRENQPNSSLRLRTPKMLTFTHRLARGITVRVVQDETYNALAAADVAIVSSGTATVEAALLNTPMVVVYRVSPLTAILAKPLVRTALFCNGQSDR